MTTYRRIAAEFEAVQFDGTYASAIAAMAFLEATPGDIVAKLDIAKRPEDSTMTIPTGDGMKTVNVWDWITRDSGGSLDVQRNDRFHRTHVAVNEEQHHA